MNYAVSNFWLYDINSRPYIIDLESINGTYLNNQRVEPRRFYELKEKVSMFLTWKSEVNTKHSLHSCDFDAIELLNFSMRTCSHNSKGGWGGGGGDDNSNFLISENNINLQIAGMLPRKSWVAFFVSQAGVGEISWQPALRDILEIEENKF